MAATIIQPAKLTVRHITPDPASPRKLLGTGLAAAPDGLNGDYGWQSATMEEAVSEPGEFQLRLPNAVGPDGRLHRDRFAVCGDGYHPGDEWIEVWRDGDVQPIYVGTPLEPTLSLSEITIAGQDARAPEVLGKQRETAAGFLLGAPHDVIAELCGGWAIPAAQDFTSPDAPAMSQTSSTQTTADGRFSYLRADNTPQGARLAPAGAAARVQTVATVPTGRLTRVWRAECTIVRSALTTTAGLVIDQAAGEAADLLALSVASGTTAGARSGASTVVYTPTPPIAIGGAVTLAIEGRGRWAFFYVDARLAAVLPIVHTGPVDRAVAVVANGATDATVQSLLVRKRDTFITPKILDRRTAGAPPKTGLQGAYYNETAPPAGQPARNLIPTQDAYARRVDRTIDFPVVNPPAWQPPGSAGTTMSVRWMGSIQLELATTDIRLRVTCNDQATVWIGDTRLGSEYLTGPAGTTTGPWLRTLLGSVSGWYPIIIEYTNLAAAGGITLEAERSVASGTWAKPGAASPAPALSPYGIYEHYARFDAHAEQITDILSQSGLQTRLTPRSLESGEFPAVMEIAPRVGRDTELEYDATNLAELTRQGSASDVATALICEASRPAGSTDDQLTLEVFALEEVGKHVLFHQDTESVADITDRALLAQRASALSALRASPVEEIGVRPTGHRELADTFPLTGALAEFRWRAGDGIRRNLPELATTDQTPTQLLRVSWPTFPGGLGAPNVSFRTRPRGLRETLRQLARRAALTQRDSRP